MPSQRFFAPRPRDRRAKLGVVPSSDKSFGKLPRWTGPFYLGTGVVTLVWVGFLVADFLNVPGCCPEAKIRCGAFMSTSARQYTLAWVVFDIALAAMLLITGWLAVRHRPHVQVSAAVTSALLFVDAWFDTTISPRRDRPLAWTQALFAELPLGLLCLWVAWRAERLRREQLRHSAATAGQASHDRPPGS
ncbi:predicted protein [Streptomyces sp. AA4]|nr:predicted protein [Streptomyces sp. AA4]